MRVRRQTAIGQVDAPAIEELAGGRDSNEHRRVTVLGNADGRGSPCSSFRHAFLLRASPADAVAHSRPDNARISCERPLCEGARRPSPPRPVAEARALVSFIRLFYGAVASLYFVSLARAQTQKSTYKAGLPRRRSIA